MRSIEVKRLSVGQMQSNCYIAYDKASGVCVVIDPGDEADYIQRVISDTLTTPVAIIATHGHFDHIMAAHELKLAYDIPFVCSPKDKFLLARLRKTAKHFLGVDTLPSPKIDISTRNKLKFDSLEFRVIETPGHTPGSICLLEEKEGLLFSGDLIFSDGLSGRSDFEYADEDLVRESIRKIKDLPEDTLVLPGHGEPFLLKNF